MSKSETRISPVIPTREFGLENLGHGVKGRSIPDEELNLDEDQIRKLAKESGSEAFAKFLYSIYKIEPDKKKK